MNREIRRLINEKVDKAFDDSEAVALLNKYIEGEQTNAEVISTNIDRIEALEEEIEKLKKEQ